MIETLIGISFLILPVIIQGFLVRQLVTDNELGSSSPSILQADHR